MPKTTPNQAIEAQVNDIIVEYKELENQAAELSKQSKAFANFIQAQKQFKDRSELVWGIVLQDMTKHNIKSIKGDWGSISVTERMNFTIDEKLLKPKYFKKAPDLKKIGDEFKLTGIAPAGALPKPTRFLTKRFKDIEEKI